MNHLRKKSAVQKHFSEPYQSLEEIRAGIKADEAAYSEEEIEEIIEGIGLKAKEASQPAEEAAKPFPEAITKEEMAEFKAWKAGGLSAQSSSELAAAVAKPSRYRDFEIFLGNVIKEAVENPFNPSQPNVIIKHIDLGKKLHTTRIEPHLAREFNEFAIGQDAGQNHGDVSTAQFYFPTGERKNGDQVSYTEFAAFQRQDNRYAQKYEQRKNIHLLHAAGYGAAIV